MAFAPDGTAFMDYMLFRAPSGPANLMVFARDGTVRAQLPGSIGLWSSMGSALYFTAPNYATPYSTELDELDSNGQRHTASTSLKGYWWPTLAPDGAKIVYNAPDSSVPDCGGVPHLWSVDLQTGKTMQLTKAQSSTPVFVGPNVIWSNEEQLTQCGLGGPSQPDGVILAHDLTTGIDSHVDLSFYRDLAGAPPQYITSAWILDTKL